MNSNYASLQCSTKQTVTDVTNGSCAIKSTTRPSCESDNYIYVYIYIFSCSNVNRATA